MAKTMYQATGRRKSSVARVRLLPGAGNIIINKRDIDTYFGEKDIVKNEVKRPLELTGTMGSFDVIATVNGGGFTGQAGALRHGILQTNAQGSRLPDKRPKNEGKKETWSQEGKKSKPVLQEIISAERLLIRKRANHKKGFPILGELLFSCSHFAQ